MSASPADDAVSPEHTIVPPAQYLFRSATPAVGFLGGSIGRTSPARRNSIGPYCAEFETKCAQGDWCCNTGETCSFDTVNGAYLCCGASAGAAGCARVCAVGTFQCGSVCCTHGQTCFGGDTVSGYCAHVNQTQTQNPLAQPTAIRTTPGLENFATATRGVESGAAVTGSNRDGSSSSFHQDQTRNSSGGGLTGYANRHRSRCSSPCHRHRPRHLVLCCSLPADPTQRRPNPDGREKRGWLRLITRLDQPITRRPGVPQASARRHDCSNTRPAV